MLRIKLSTVIICLLCICGCQQAETTSYTNLNYSKNSFPINYEVQYLESSYLYSDYEKRYQYQTDNSYNLSAKIHMDVEEITSDNNLVISINEIKDEIELEKGVEIKPTLLTIKPSGELVAPVGKYLDKKYFPPISAILPQNATTDQGSIWETIHTESVPIASKGDIEINTVVNLKYKIKSRVVASNTKLNYLVINESIEILGAPSISKSGDAEGILQDKISSQISGNGFYIFKYEERNIDDFSRVIRISISTGEINANKIITRKFKIIK